MDNFILFLGFLVDFSAFSSMCVELIPEKVEKVDDGNVRLSVKLNFECNGKYNSTTATISNTLIFTSLTWNKYEKVIKNKDIVQETKDRLDTRAAKYNFVGSNRINLLDIGQQEALLEIVRARIIQCKELQIESMNSIIDKLLFP